VDAASAAVYIRVMRKLVWFALVACGGGGQSVRVPVAPPAHATGETPKSAEVKMSPVPPWPTTRVGTTHETIHGRAISDPYRIGCSPDDVARDEDPGRVRDRDEDDGVRHAIGERRVHGLRHHGDALDPTVPGAREAAEVEAPAGFADIFGRMLDVAAQPALLQRQHAGREEVAIARIEPRQRPVVAQDALHAGAPNSTALPGA